MSAPVCLIVNPTAAGGKAGRLAPAVERSLCEQGLIVRRVNTRDIQHARELGLAAAREGETVLALSGDGMVGVLADALREVPGARLGVLPGGRGNDLARVLGIPREPLAACAASQSYLPRALDLGVVEDARAGQPGRAFVGVASAGFDSDCNRIANEAPAWLGSLAYAYSALRGLLSWKPARFTIELDPPGERKLGRQRARHQFLGGDCLGAAAALGGSFAGAGCRDGAPLENAPLGGASTGTSS